MTPAEQAMRIKAIILAERGKSYVSETGTDPYGYRL